MLMTCQTNQLGQMLKIRKYINPKILTSIYFAIFQSHLYDMWILMFLF